MQSSFRILSLAQPLIIGQIGQLLIGVTSTLMLGRLGVDELAAGAFSQTLQGTVLVSATGGLQILAPTIAKKRMHENNSQVNAYIANSQKATWIMAASATLLVFLLSVDFSIFNQPPQVVQLLQPYYFVCGISIFAAICTSGTKFLLDGLGHAKETSCVVVLILLLNVMLSSALMHGWLFGIQLGMFGAGIATLLSRLAGMIVMERILAEKIGFGYKKFTVSFSEATKQVKKNLPGSVMAFAEYGAFSVAGILAGQFGAEALAANQIALQITSATFVTSLALSQSTCILAAQELKFCRSKAIIGNGYLLTLSLMTSAGVVIFLLRHQIPTLFVNSENVSLLAAKLLTVIAFYQFFDGSQLMGLAALRSVNDLKLPSIVVFTAYWALAVPLGYLLAFEVGWGPQGLWIGLTSAMGIIGVFCLIRLTSVLKRSENQQASCSRSSLKEVPEQ